MKCPKCQFDNREGAKFCGKCRAKLLLVCSQCNSENPPDNVFCDECGQDLRKRQKPREPTPLPESERKYVTVLFSDLSGYTAMSEKLDPEDVKEITSRIFGRIFKVIGKYEGFVEKIVGDAVMALFGVPKSHEDDPVRAIRAAREIHDLVEALSPELEERVGRPLSMHTGINTGLVVTGEVDMEKGTHGVAGDSINLASRLSGLAKPGEILVTADTYRQAEGYFTFEAMEPTTVKGKTEPVQFYKVISQKEIPVTTHRLSGVRANLVGRKVELTELREAVEDLGTGKGRIFSISGDAGTGKSRLVEEFKANLDLEKIQWLEGHAYAYAQNIPYFPMIDLLNRVFRIEEGDSTEKVRQKVESGVEDLIEKKESIVPYIGSLYSLSYPEIEEVSPEFWKSRLRDVLQMILSALAERAPTIYFLEDLHWADPSFVELLRYALLEIRQPAIVLCVYRPTISLFTSQQLSGLSKFYHEIRLQDLSLSDAQEMLESLLKTERIPSDLKRFVQDKAEGNPFYLEELVNSLIETETLIRDNGSWKLTRPIAETDISSTIHGVISGRLDRLEKETKRILQEASVIGRAFLYEILNRVTELKDHIDHSLRSMERLDLIRAGSLEPDLEYIFKHALTQEVVYNGLLKKERQEIHERVAFVIEQIFHDRLPEVYETLSFHFKQSESDLKAIDYLIKAGEKSLKRYALEEAHRYYKDAFDILINKPDKSRDKGLLIDLVIKWAFVFYYRGDYKGLTDLLSTHKGLAESLDDKSRLGMFYAWIGTTLYYRGKVKDSYEYLFKALKLGELIQNQQVIGYACNHLTWTCTELGLLDEAILFGKRAQEISKIFESDHYIYFISLSGMGFAHFCKGEVKRALEAGKALVDYGRKHFNVRSMVLGHFTCGHSYSVAGDFPSAIKCYQKAIEVSVDPFYSQFPRFFLGMSYVQNGQFQEGEKALQEVVKYSENFGAETLGIPANVYLGVVSITKGYMSRGLKMIEESLQLFQENERKSAKAIVEYALGKVYFQIVEGAGPINLLTITRNLGFLAKNVPFAARKAEDHLEKAIGLAKETGGKAVLGQAYLDLGLLHKAKKRKDRARECISETIKIFEQCDAEIFLKQAKEALAFLK
jgi:class 3 adenylate cyclase/tetratricopeptide (TPR) repeat protein